MLLVVVVVVDVVVVFLCLGIVWTTEDLALASVAYTTLGFLVVDELALSDLGILCTTEICSWSGGTVVDRKPVPFAEE